MSKAIIGIDKSKSYRVYITITTDMVQKAVDIHNKMCIRDSRQLYQRPVLTKHQKLYGGGLILLS